MADILQLSMDLGWRKGIIKTFKNQQNPQSKFVPTAFIVESMVTITVFMPAVRRVIVLQLGQLKFRLN